MLLRFGEAYRKFVGLSTFFALFAGNCVRCIALTKRFLAS